MAQKEADLTVITNTDLGGSDFVRVLDGNASRKITLTELVAALDTIASWVAKSGDTMTGNLSISNVAAAAITLATTGAANATATITSGSNNKAILNLGDTGDDNIGSLVYDNADDSLAITINAAEAIKIDSAQRVALGITVPNAKAILTLNSTTTGFLPPVMTTTQRDAIATPPPGLQIYNSSTNKINFYNGAAWEAVTSA